MSHDGGDTHREAQGRASDFTEEGGLVGRPFPVVSAGRRGGGRVSRLMVGWCEYFQGTLGE